MLFENKTNSQILAKLQVPERVLSQLQMTRPGWGLDVLEALHTIISPEEIKVRQRELKITDHQLERLFDWLDCNCDVTSLMKRTNNGYQFSMIGIVDNNSYGVLTKIRRHLIDWQPEITPKGKIYFQPLKWMDDPELILENEDSKLFIRKGLPIYEYGHGKKQSSKAVSTYCYRAMQDEYYENHPMGFKKINGRWQIASKQQIKVILDAIKVMKLLTA